MARPTKIKLSEETVLNLLNRLSTQKEVAERLHVHPVTLSRFVRDRFEYHCEWRRKPISIEAGVIDAKSTEV